MEVKFISNKPWVDETVKLRKALFFTTLAMVLVGLVFCIIGGVLIFYMEYPLGVISLVLGVLLPVLYVGANAILFRKRRKDYDKGMIIEYNFTEDAVEIVKISDTYKSKAVIDYSNLSVTQVFNKSRYIIIKTTANFADYILLRKADIELKEGENKHQAIASFVSFLMAKIANATTKVDTTCADSVDNSDVVTAEDNANIDLDPQSNDVEDFEGEGVVKAEDGVTFDDFTTKDEVVDIEDERLDVDDEKVDSKFEVIEDEVDDVYDDEDGVEDAPQDTDEEIVDEEDKED